MHRGVGCAGAMSFRDGIKAATLNGISWVLASGARAHGALGATIGAWGARALGLDPRVRRTLLACGSLRR